MSQHIFWYGKDGSLAGKMRNQLYQYGFQVHLFEVIPDLINRLKEEMPSALVFDFYEAGGHFRDTVEIDRILTQVAPKTPFICIAPPGEDLVNWLAAYRAGASTCFPRPIQFFDILDRLDRILEKQSESPYRVFMIDDDENLMEHMSLILKKTGMEVHYETKPGAALKALPEFKPDLILLDLYMPQISGMELSHIIRQDNRWLTVPIVFLSRETEVAKQLEALDKGGDDFLLKPVKYRFLYHSLSSRIKRARVLRSYLTRDALTGLLNHTVLQEHLEDFVSGETNHFVFAIVDIDNFKALNDRMGHQIGDQLLKSLAILLKRHLGKDALVGRFGGEEFGVILKDVSTSEAQAMLEGIRQNFNQIVHETDDDSFQQTFSCGYAAYPQFNTVTTLIDGAEKALSQAKSMGKNMVQTAVPMFRSEKTPDAPDLPDEDLIILDDGDDLVDLDTGQIDADLVSASDNINITTVVVDDDPQVLQHISTVMLEKGFQVYQAANGEEGYKLAERYKPDLILIDLLLFPGIHGFELCQKVRELLPDIRIILMTAVYKDYRYRLEGKEAGADDFIEKPINYPVLLDKIKTLLPEAVV